MASIATIICVEILLKFLPTAIKQFFSLLTRILYIVGSSSISDHWKEKILLVYAARLMKSTLYIFVVLVLGFAIFIVLYFVPALDIVSIVYSWQGILYTTCFAGLYVYVRKKIFGASAKDSNLVTSDYSEMSQILHRMILGNKVMPVLLFHLERLLLFRQREKTQETPVFVCGLARAGTTMLMREIYNTGAFVSLTYADMPFVTSPNIWRIMSGSDRNKEIIKERAHGDGVMVTTNSPEALEEVFWKNFCGDDYLFSTKLVPHNVPKKTRKYFRQYISLIANNERYLSKNNNNLLRIDALVEIFNEAIILVPFRKPMAHAKSLLKQHQRFCKMSDDAFVKEYMVFLAHHEFGAAQKPFIFGSEKQYENTAHLNYWLELWVNTYEFLYSRYCDKVVFVAYEQICDKSSNTWVKISQLIGQQLPSEQTIFYNSDDNTVCDIDENLLVKAENIYQKMLATMDKEI